MISGAPGPIPLQRIAELVVEQAKDYAIFTLDNEGLITSWSPGASRIIGYTADEAIGTSFAIMFTASDLAAGHDRRELATALRDGRAEDTRWHLRKGGERFWANGVTFALSERDLQGLLKIIRDETPARRAEEQRVLLLNELNHRINNTLITVQALVDQTLRSREIEPSVRSDITARLIALADAHKVLVDQNWAGAELGALVERALAPYRQDGQSADVSGPPLRLSSQQAVAMSLVLHEVTNALKYGALSTPTGLVEVSWNLMLDVSGKRYMTFLWLERGGPAVAAPIRKGFGTLLIERSLGQQRSSRVTVDYESAGVRCSIELALSSDEEIPPLDIAQAVQAAETSSRTS